MKTQDGGTLVPVMTNWEVFYATLRAIGQCQAHAEAMANAATGESQSLTKEMEHAIFVKFKVVMDEMKRAKQNVECSCEDGCGGN
jgi:hypothetical protein